MIHYLQLFKIICKQNFRITTLASMTIAVILVIIIPLYRGVDHLDEMLTAACIQQSFLMIGIPLFVGISDPEMNSSIYSVVVTRAFTYPKTKILRFVMNLSVLTLLVILFLLSLEGKDCIFPFGLFFSTTLLKTVYLGGIGWFVASLVRNTLFGYLTSLIVFVINLTGSGEALKRVGLPSLHIQDDPELFKTFVLVVLMTIYCVYFTTRKT